MKTQALMTLLLLSGFVALGPSPAQAQCGDECEPCGFLGLSREGVDNEVGLDIWDATCPMELRMSCDLCGGLVSDASVSAAQVIEAVETTDLAALLSVAEQYGDRLLLSQSRHLVVVKGTSCASEALAAVTFISAEATDVLRRLGIASLENYIATASLSE